MLTLVGVVVLSVLCFELWKDSKKRPALEEFVRDVQLLGSLNSELQLALTRGEEMKANHLPYALILPELTATWIDMIKDEVVSVQAKIAATRDLIDGINSVYTLWQSPLKQDELKITALDQSLPAEKRLHARHLLEQIGVALGPVFPSKVSLRTTLS